MSFHISCICKARGRSEEMQVRMAWADLTRRQVATQRQWPAPGVAGQRRRCRHRSPAGHVANRSTFSNRKTHSTSSKGLLKQHCPDILSYRLLELISFTLICEMGRRECDDICISFSASYEISSSIRHLIGWDETHNEWVVSTLTKHCEK